jgi:hypothetical protein
MLQIWAVVEAAKAIAAGGGIALTNRVLVCYRKTTKPARAARTIELARWTFMLV